MLDGSCIGGVHKVESVLAAHGITGKHLVVSEVGASTNPVDVTFPQMRMSGSVAAGWVGTMLDQLRRIPHMEAVCVHQAKDDSTAQDWLHNYGLVDTGDVRRPSWAVVDAAVVA